MDNKHGTVKWIVGLCVASTIAIVGWTVTGTLTVRLKSLDEVKANVAIVSSNVAANNIRISVLENKYEAIQASLADIKALLTQHMAK